MARQFGILRVFPIPSARWRRIPPVKSTKKIRAKFWSGSSVLLLLCGLLAAPSASPQIARETVGGLRMTISLERTLGKHSKTPEFALELRNVSETDLILNLGVMLANGKRQYLTAVTFRLTEMPGKSRKLSLREPMLISGRVDPLIVPLPAGAKFFNPHKPGSILGGRIAGIRLPAAPW